MSEPNHANGICAGSTIDFTRYERINAGKEGVIYRKGQSAYKLLFDSELCQSKRDKIELLVGLRSSLPYNIAAPRDVIYDQKGKVIGYEMPFINGDSIEDHLFRPDSGSSIETADEKRYELLRELLELLEGLHRKRIVFGDLHPGNIVIHEDTPFLVDVDTVQIPGFSCTVNVPEYTDPTVLRIVDAGTVVFDSLFTKFTDYYALMTMAFEMLVWCHPRRAASAEPPVPNAGVRDMDARGRWLREGKWWPFSPGVTPMRQARDPSEIRPDVMDLFRFYFTTDKRPVPLSSMFTRVPVPQPVFSAKKASSSNPRLRNYSALSGALDNIWGDAKLLKGEAGNLRGCVSDLVGRLSIHGQINGLHGDVSRISGDVSGIHGDCSNINGDVTGLVGPVSNLCGSVTAINGRIEISGNVSKLAGDVSLLRGLIDPMKSIWGDATGVSLDVTGHQGNVRDLHEFMMVYETYFGQRLDR